MITTSPSEKQTQFKPKTNPIKPNFCTARLFTHKNPPHLRRHLRSFGLLYLFLASQGFTEEKLMIKPLSLSSISLALLTFFNCDDTDICQKIWKIPLLLSQYSGIVLFFHRTVCSGNLVVLNIINFCKGVLLCFY